VCEAHGFEPLRVAEACLRGGARLLQLRIKNGRGAAFLRLAEAFVRAASPFAARVVVNDRADVAVLSGAAGVHVGQQDISVEAAFSIVGPGGLVGLSTHDEAQVDAAMAGPASYVAVGPVFTTATKDTGYSARGLELVRYAAAGRKPIVAIGGITLARANEVIAAGAGAVAVIGDLFATGDPEGRTRAFLASMPARPFNV
jgi:thiamine-phosphate pyrophosphorylase